MKRLEAVVSWFIVLFGFPFAVGSANASEIYYSWSGLLVPANMDDPWQLGAGGQPFLLHVAVPFDATDLADLDVEFAAFEVSQARLVLSGQEVPFLGNGTIDFTDNVTDQLDLISFEGDFRHLEETIPIGSVVVPPMGTFQFSQSIHLPPFFRSTRNVLQAGCCGRPYASIVAVGSPISVVAEPVSIAICTGNGFLVIALRRRRESLL